MTTITVRPIRDDLSFGARVGGVTLDQTSDPEVREQPQRGLRGARAADLRGRRSDARDAGGDQHRVRAAQGPSELGDAPGRRRLLGVIEIRHEPNEGGVVELDGRRLSQWLPWHFDHCYNDQLNRAGVLRAVEIPPGRRA